MREPGNLGLLSFVYSGDEPSRATLADLASSRLSHSARMPLVPCCANVRVPPEVALSNMPGRALHIGAHSEMGEEDVEYH